MSTYRIGSVTVNNGSTAVTGSGTAWVSAGIRAGDFLFVNGLFGEVASVQTNTALTLVRGWPGSNASGQQYSIALIDDGQRSIAALNQVLQALGSGTLTSLAGLAGVANELPYWTGPGVMARAPLTAAARAMLALAGSAGARIPVITGTGTAALRQIVGTVSQSAGLPTGAVIERGSNANGSFTRWADGTQVCFLNSFILAFQSSTNLRADWTFPAAFSGRPVISGIAQVAGGTSLTPNVRELRAIETTTAGSSATVGRLNCSLILGAPSSYGSGDTLSVDAMAIGRWF